MTSTPSLLQLVLLTVSFPLLLIGPWLLLTLVSSVIVSLPLQLQYGPVVQHPLWQFFLCASGLPRQVAGGEHLLLRLAFFASPPPVRLPLASHAPLEQAFFTFPTHQIPSLVFLLLF